MSKTPKAASAVTPVDTQRVRATRDLEQLRHAELLAVEDLFTLYGWRTNSVEHHIRENGFPRPVKIGRSVRWVKAELDSWVARLVAQRDQGVAV